MSRIGPPEPGSVALETRRSVADVLWVANTRHGPGGHWFARVTHDDGDHDHLETGGDAVRYLVDHRVELPAEPPSADDLASLAAIREMVRGLLDPEAGWSAGVLTIMARASYRVDEAGRITATGAGWPAFLGDLLPPLLDVVRRRDRLSICGNPVCRLVFIDESRSGTRRWCDDAGCGNRDRVRRHRRRGSAEETAGRAHPAGA
jgi:hypothetical protein